MAGVVVIMAAAMVAIVVAMVAIENGKKMKRM
jgi:hypothetical protein